MSACLLSSGPRYGMIILSASDTDTMRRYDEMNKMFKKTLITSPSSSFDSYHEYFEALTMFPDRHSSS